MMDSNALSLSSGVQGWHKRGNVKYSHRFILICRNRQSCLCFKPWNWTGFSRTTKISPSAADSLRRPKPRRNILSLFLRWWVKQSKSKLNSFHTLHAMDDRHQFSSSYVVQIREWNKRNYSISIASVVLTPQYTHRKKWLHGASFQKQRIRMRHFSNSAPPIHLFRYTKEWVQWDSPFTWNNASLWNSGNLFQM